MKIAMAVVMGLLALAPAGNLELGKPVGDVALGKDTLAALTKDGKVVAVYFWSSDCPYGPPNFENIKKVDAAYADNAKVKVVIVSSFGEPEAKAVAWAKDSDIKGSFLYDGDKHLAKFFNPRKVNASFVIDAKGNLFYRGGIANDQENLLFEAIKAALDGKAAPASDQKFEGCGIRAS